MVSRPLPLVQISLANNKNIPIWDIFVIGTPLQYDPRTVKTAVDSIIDNLQDGEVRRRVDEVLDVYEKTKKKEEKSGWKAHPFKMSYKYAKRPWMIEEPKDPPPGPSSP